MLEEHLVEFQSPALRGGFPDQNRPEAHEAGQPCFNPLHYGEGFLTNGIPVSCNGSTGRFNPLHYGEGFLTRRP